MGRGPLGQVGEGRRGQAGVGVGGGAGGEAAGRHCHPLLHPERTFHLFINTLDQGSMAHIKVQCLSGQTDKKNKYNVDNNKANKP